MNRVVEAVAGIGLVKRFGATAALRGVDVVLRPGLSLVEGANGSGKSTLLSVLGLSLSASSGAVEYRAADGVLTPVEARAATGWLSHETLAYGDLSGRENVELVARVHGLAVREAWTEVAARFQLGSFAERPLRTNSRGQRQRVALARALVHRPSVVLLDEPTTGLDQAGVGQLVEVVREEVAAGRVVAVVTHEREVFSSLVAQEVVLERGRRVS